MAPSGNLYKAESIRTVLSLPVMFSLRQALEYQKADLKLAM